MNVNLPSHVRVAIIGGGPAGALTALQLARRGVASTVLEAAPTFASKVGETLAPNCSQLFAQLGLSHLLQDPAHLHCHGNQYLWGSDKAQEKPFLAQTQAHGWHVDRARLEAQLAQVAQASGLVEWRMDSKLQHAENATPDAPWQLQLEQHGREQQMQADFVVDASGRSGKIARSVAMPRVQLDRLVGLANCYHLPHEASAHVLQYASIEAVEYGWWYCAPLSQQRLVTIFMSDNDLMPKMMRSSTGYWQALQRTSLLRDHLQHLMPGGPGAIDREREPLARLASSSYLEQITGTNWLAVGDAAYAYDPISSYGITAALGAGFYAGNAIADHLQGKKEALAAYRFVQMQAYRAYLEMLENQYALETRWPDSPFWQRRQGGQTSIAA